MIMKNMNSRLFDKKETLSKIEMGACLGGNKSDVNYSDTKKDGVDKWDIAVDSVIDTVNSSKSLDKPSATVSLSEYAELV
jgi:hypothetical protein